MALLQAGIGALVLAGAAMAAISRYVAAKTEARFPANGEFATVDGVKLHYIDTAPGGGADGLPVVFIHGAGGNARDLRHMADTESRKGRRVIFVDRPGAGYSQRGDSRSASPVRQAELIAGLLKAIGIRKAIIVGHSLGGAVALAMAIEHGEAVAGLVLVAPASHQWPGGRVTWYYRFASAPLLGRLFAATIAVPVGTLLYERAVKEIFLPDEVPDGYFSESGTRLVLRPANFFHNAHDVAALFDHIGRLSRRYGEIDVPAVIITGDRDGVVSPEYHAKRLAREIRNTRLVMMENTGHMPGHVDSHSLWQEIDLLDRSIDRGKTGVRARAS